MTPIPDWTVDFPGAVTVCDAAGRIVSMNAAAARVFAKDGGEALVGKDVRACHPERARGKLDELLAGGAPNAYTIEKAGRRKLIYQAPFWKDGRLAGVVELSLELPADMPHFVRAP